MSYRRLIPSLFDSVWKLNALLKLFTPNFTFSKRIISATAQLTSIISFKKGFWKWQAKYFFIVGNYLNCIFGFMHNKSCGKNIHIADRFPVPNFLSFFFLYFFRAMTLMGFCQVIKMRVFLGATCSFQAEQQRARRHIGRWMAGSPSTGLGCWKGSLLNKKPFWCCIQVGRSR